MVLESYFFQFIRRIYFSVHSSSFMGREESTRTPICKSKEGKSLRKMAYCTTVPFPFVILGEE